MSEQRTLSISAGSGALRRATPQRAQASPRTPLEKACAEFESLFIHALIKQMRSSVPRGEGIFDQSTGEEIFNDFMDQEFARRMAFSGGVGIGAMVQKRYASHTDALHGGVKNVPKETVFPADIYSRTEKLHSHGSGGVR